MVKHLAFTLIELIFAIVIIGITVLSLPMVNQVMAKNNERALSQEVVFAAAAELNQALSYRWDENSADGSNTMSRVTWIQLDCNETTRLRPGHISQPLHRRCTDLNTTTASTILGLDAESIPDDLDDINQTQKPIFVILGGGTVTGSQKGYKQNYTSIFNINYSEFGPASLINQNVKQISVTIYDENNDTITSLTTFSANIGEADTYKRLF